MATYHQRTPTGRTQRTEATLSMGQRGHAHGWIPGVKVFVGKHVMSFTLEEAQAIWAYALGDFMRMTDPYETPAQAERRRAMLIEGGKK